MSEMPMELEFKPDGTYGGTATGGTTKVTGTYTVDGDTLVMEAPQMTGPEGTSTDPGGKMRLKMEPTGSDSIHLISPPSFDLTITRK